MPVQGCTLSFYLYMERQLISLNEINIIQDLHLEVNESARFGSRFSSSLMEIGLSDDNTRHFKFMPHQHPIQII